MTRGRCFRPGTSLPGKSDHAQPSSRSSRHATTERCNKGQAVDNGPHVNAPTKLRDTRCTQNWLIFTSPARLWKNKPARLVRSIAQVSNNCGAIFLVWPGRPQPEESRAIPRKNVQQENVQTSRAELSLLENQKFNWQDELLELALTLPPASIFQCLL